MKKRLGLYVFYDREGIVDDYVIYQLADLKQNLEHLTVIVNGLLTPEGRGRLEAITKDIVVRENKGLDVAAWRFAMVERLGWDKIEEYDEIVFMNDTCYGPVYPLKVVFEKMDSKASLDFWGMTKHGKMDNWQGLLEKGKAYVSPYGYLPAHIQTYFFVIRKNMFSSQAFQSYFEKMPVYDSFEEVVTQHEIVFTKYFEDLGFNWDVYVNTDDMDRSVPNDNAIYSAYELLRRAMPLVKRKLFIRDLSLLLRFTMAEDGARIIEYIKAHSDYDVGMIYKNLLRGYNITDIFNGLHLNYIIPKDKITRGEMPDGQVAVFLHLYYTEKLDKYVHYIENIPKYIDVIITTVSDEKALLIHEALDEILGSRLSVIVFPNRGRDMAALLVAARLLLEHYEYFCFCHDKVSAQVEYSIGSSFEDNLWENTLASGSYIENVLKIFRAEPYLGVLTVPAPLGGFIIINRDKFWGDNYKNTQSLLERINMTVPMSEDKMPLTIGNAFWARRSALDKILSYEWKYEDFPEEPMPVDGTISHALERSWAFVAQDAGYYTATCMNEEYASLMINAYQYYNVMSKANTAAAVGVSRRDIIIQAMKIVKDTPFLTLGKYAVREGKRYFRKHVLKKDV